MRKEYSLKPFFKIAYILNGTLLFLIVFLKLQNLLFPRSHQWLWTILVIFFAIVAIVFLYNALFEKLIISASGIEHRTFLQHLFLSWEQVESIPTQFNSKILIAKSSKDTKKLTVSLFLFADNPIDAELGQHIKQYAPHLFVQKKQ